MTKQVIKKIQHKFRNPTSQLFAAIALFIVSVAATRLGDVPSWEISLFNTIYELPDFLRWFFFVMTQLGSIHMLLILVVIYLTISHYHVVLRLLLTGSLSYMLSGVAKDLWGRARPNDLLDTVVNLDYVVRGPGFPSGHTALATALALTIGHYLPKKYHPLIWIWIISVALSRLYLGIHFPMDIVGGFAIGWASYAMFRHVRLYDVTFGPRKNTLKKK